MVALTASAVWSYRRTRLVATSTSDGRKYRVLKGDKEAAESLARLHQNVSLLLQRLQAKSESFDADEKKCLERIITRYRPLSLIETEPIGDQTAFTVNKGETIALCLRSAKDKKLHNDNELLLVTLHELAHVGSPMPDPFHGPVFQKHFDFLRRAALDFGLLARIDKPWEYCGVSVDPIDR